MRKVNLTMYEQDKYEATKKLIETNGNKLRLAEKFGVTKRTVNNWIRLYKEQGKEGFVHKNRGRIPHNAFTQEKQELLVNLYTSAKYEGVNVAHFCELLNEQENIHVSDTTVRNLLYDHDILSPKAHRKTRNKKKKELKARLKQTNTKKEQTVIQTKLIDAEDAHPHRPRSKYFGEMIQTDASSYVWFGNEVTHLHVAVDDAKGTVVGAYFDTQETLNGYYHMTKQILMNYGIPAMFYSDKRTVFEYKRKNAPSVTDDTFTQFGYACKQLGIEIKTTSIPQVKGRVERLNQTLQSRLPIELRIAGVQTIEEANEFLKSYLPKFNKRFSIPIDSTKSVFEKQPSNEVINQTLAVLSERTIDDGHCIKYKNNYYIPISINAVHQYFPYKTKALVIEALDGSLFVTVDESVYALEKIEKQLSHSPSFDELPTPKQPRKIYIPPMSHPWKARSFNAYLQQQKHRSGANV